MNVLEKFIHRQEIRRIDNCIIHKIFFKNQQIHDYGLDFEERIDNAYKMVTRKPEKEKEYKTLLFNLIVKKNRFSFTEKILQYINWIYFIPIAILFYLLLPETNQLISMREDLFASVIPRIHTSVKAYFIILCILADMYTINWIFCIVTAIYGGLIVGSPIMMQMQSQSGFFYDFCLRYNIDSSILTILAFYGIPAFYILLTFICYLVCCKRNSLRLHQCGAPRLYQYSAPDTFRDCYDDVIQGYCLNPVDLDNLKEMIKYCTEYVPKNWVSKEGHTSSGVCPGKKFSFTKKENEIIYEALLEEKTKIEIDDMTEKIEKQALITFFKEAYPIFGFEYKKGEKE